MLQDIKVMDAVNVRVETRSTGRVRLSMDHAFVDLQRCEMAPGEALTLAHALVSAAEVIWGLAGNHPQSLAFRASAEAPSPGRECASRPECMDKGCQSGKCQPMSFQPLQNGAAGYSMPGEWPKGPESFGGA